MCPAVLSPRCCMEQVLQWQCILAALPHAADSQHCWLILPQQCSHFLTLCSHFLDASSLSQGRWGSFPGQQFPLGQKARTLRELLEGCAVCEGGVCQSTQALSCGPAPQRQPAARLPLGWLVCVSTGVKNKVVFLGAVLLRISRRFFPVILEANVGIVFLLFDWEACLERGPTN